MFSTGDNSGKLKGSKSVFCVSSWACDFAIIGRGGPFDLSLIWFLLLGS